MKKIEKYLFKLILGEEKDNSYDSFIKKSSLILSIFSLLCGLTLIFFGNQIIDFFKKIESFSALEVTGIFLVLISLMYYLIYFLSKQDENQPGMKFILRVAFYSTVLTIIFLIYIASVKSLNDIGLHIFSLLIIIETIIILISLFSILVILFNAVYRALKEPSEKVTLLLGIFATIITFIITVLKEFF